MANGIGNIAIGGSWKDVKTRYVGKDGDWKKQLWRFTGHNGYWRLSHIDSIIDKTALFYISGCEGFEFEPGNNVVLFGDGFKWSQYPFPRTGLFMPLESNVADIFENFGNGLQVGYPSFQSIDGLKALFLSYSSDWVEFNSGVDFEGIVGSSGNKSFTLAAWFYLGSLPGVGQKKSILNVGNAQSRIDLYIDDSGAIKADVVINGVVNQLTSETIAEPSKWIHVVFVVDKTNSIMKLYVDSFANVVSTAISANLSFTTDAENKKLLIGAYRVISSSAGIQYWQDPPSSAYALSDGTPNGIAISGSTSYKYCRTGMPLSPNTGKYYFEIEVVSMSGVMWLGLCNTTDDPSTAIGVSSYSFSSISRKFNHQTGGGTTYLSGAATWTAGDVVGFVYDSDTGELSAYKNGALMATVFAAGTIAQDVLVAFASDNAGSIVSHAKSSEWTAAPTGLGTLNEIPSPMTYTATEIGSGDIAVKNVYFGNTAADDFNVKQLLNAKKCGVTFKNTDTDVEYQVPDNYMGSHKEDRFNFTIPESIPAGNYRFYGVVDMVKSVELPARVNDVKTRNTAYISNFRNESQFYADWFFMHKAWGGANGGVVKENVLFKEDGIHFLANGDLYTGETQGVDQYGKPKYHDNASDPKYGQPWTNRVGSCIVFKEKTGYGSYRAKVKIPTQLGVCAAMWTFFYNEIYQGSPYYSGFQSEGLHEQGSAENGYYMVRNHEIDIELPSHLDGGTLSDPSWENMKCNTWRGELQNWGVDQSDPAYWEEYRDNLTSIGQSLADGEFHELRFDWHKDRVEFFIDDVLKRTNTNTTSGETIPDIAGHFTIGLWFPSSQLAAKPWLVDPAKGWAGGTIDADGGQKAMWERQEMILSAFIFRPFPETGIRKLGETYPFGIYRTKRL